MELINHNTISEARQFITDNISRSGFAYGNLFAENAETYVLRKEERIVGLANIINNHYCTYLIPTNTESNTVEQMLLEMKEYKHIGGTVIGDYIDLFRKYYNLPDNYLNQVATLANNTGKHQTLHDVQYLTIDECDSYKEELLKINEFNIEPETLVDRIESSQIVIAKNKNQVVAGASLVAISDISAVVTSVFTEEKHRGHGYATDCVKKLINDYAAGRTIFIFFSNPIAKHIYLGLGFEVKDTLLMFDEPKIYNGQ